MPKLTEQEARVLATVAAIGPVTRQEIADLGADVRLRLPPSYKATCSTMAWLVEYGHVEVMERVRGGQGPGTAERLRATRDGRHELHTWRERWGRLDVRTRLQA